MSTARRNGLRIAIAVIVVASGSGAFAYHRLQDRCGTDEVLSKLGPLIPRDADKDGVEIANARLAPGQFFAFPYRCEAETTPLHFSQHSADPTWQQLLYSVSGADQVVILR